MKLPIIKLDLKLIAVILLLFMNLFLILTSSNKQEDFNNLYTEYDKISSSLLDTESYLLNNAKFMHPQLSEEIENLNGLELIFLIPENSCGTCLNYEIPNLKKLVNQYEDKVNVFLIARNDRLAEHFKFEFEFKILNPTAKIFNDETVLSNPASFLVDSLGNIHSVYLSEIGNSDKSNSYFHKMDYFLSLLE